MNKDAINPEHYNSGDIYEHRKVVDAWGLDYYSGCATKYICREGKKESADPIEDLRKAIRYLEFRVEKLEKERNSEKTNEAKEEIKKEDTQVG